jgi:hypothetical protein
MSDEKVVYLKDIKDVWMQDPTIPQEEIDAFNAAFKEAAEIDPRFEKLIWERKSPTSRNR